MCLYIYILYHLGKLIVLFDLFIYLFILFTCLFILLSDILATSTVRFFMYLYKFLLYY